MKWQHQQRIFTKTRSWCEHFRYGITCHVTFQLLLKQFQCRPHCRIASSQCSFVPSQHVYSVKRQHKQRTFTKTRSSCEHFRHGITCHVTFQLLLQQFSCKPHCGINSSQCPFVPSPHVYSVQRHHRQHIFSKTWSSCEHFLYGRTYHLTFQSLQKEIVVM